MKELSTRMVKLGHQVTCYNRGGHHVSGKEFDGKKLHEYEGVKLDRELLFGAMLRRGYYSEQAMGVRGRRKE